MIEESTISGLQKARTNLSSAGFEPVAVVALDRPVIAGRMWTDGSVPQGQIQELLGTYATELAAHGLLDGTHMTSAIARQLSLSADKGLAVIVAPRTSPRLAAVVRVPPAADLNQAVEALGRSVERNESIEVAAALADATGASVVLTHGTNLVFASRSAFVHEGATGPFLGLSCLSRHAPDAMAKLARLVGGEVPTTGNMRREQVGPYTMICFIRRIGENNLALAASRFGLTRAELAEAESMIAGLSCKESASRLKISPETVRQRRKVIYRKLGVESCGTAVARILDLELPPAPEAQAVHPGLPGNGLDRNAALRQRTL